MLKIIKENQNFKKDAPSIEGYIIEVLRREYLNIINDIDIEPKEEIIIASNKNNSQEINVRNTILKNSINDNFHQKSSFLINSASNKIICKSINITESTKPQILKIQQIASKSNAVTTSALPSKPIIYMSSNPVNNLPVVSSVTHNKSPIKQNKLIKINTQLNQLVTHNTNNHYLKSQIACNSNNEHESIFYNDMNHSASGNSITDNCNAKNNNHSTQVLNLVLVTDNINGGLSYLSLIPTTTTTANNNNDNNNNDDYIQD
jgi:hypothetical protein